MIPLRAAMKTAVQIPAMASTPSRSRGSVSRGRSSEAGSSRAMMKTKSTITAPA